MSRAPFRLINEGTEVDWTSSLNEWRFWPKKLSVAGGSMTAVHLIRTPYVSISIHVFHDSDPIQSVHDHPWHFVSFMLWGSYTEQIHKDPAGDFNSSVQKKRRFLNFHRIHRDWAHRVTGLSKYKAVTFFACGRPIRKSITFWNENGRMQWLEAAGYTKPPSDTAPTDLIAT
jgi:hypothetical protein